MKNCRPYTANTVQPSDMHKSEKFRELSLLLHYLKFGWFCLKCRKLCKCWSRKTCKLAMLFLPLGLMVFWLLFTRISIFPWSMAVYLMRAPRYYTLFLTNKPQSDVINSPVQPLFFCWNSQLITKLQTVISTLEATIGEGRLLHALFTTHKPWQFAPKLTHKPWKFTPKT